MVMWMRVLIIKDTDTMVDVDTDVVDVAAVKDMGVDVDAIDGQTQHATTVDALDILLDTANIQGEVTRMARQMMTPMNSLGLTTKIFVVHLREMSLVNALWRIARRSNGAVNAANGGTITGPNIQRKCRMQLTWRWNAKLMRTRDSVLAMTKEYLLDSGQRDFHERVVDNLV